MSYHASNWSNEDKMSPVSQAKSSRGYHYGQMMSAAVRVPKLNDCEKIILALMVEATSSTIGPGYLKCQRSLAWFMHHSTKSERTVRAALRKIEDIGIFTLVEKGQNMSQHGNTTNVWQFNNSFLEAASSGIYLSWKQNIDETSTAMPESFELTQAMLDRAEEFGVDNGSVEWLYAEFVALAVEKKQVFSNWEMAFDSFVRGTWTSATPSRQAAEGFSAGSKRARGMPYTVGFNAHKAIEQFLVDGDDVAAKVEGWAYEFFKAGNTYAVPAEFKRFVADLLAPKTTKNVKPVSEPTVDRQRPKVFHEPPPSRFVAEPSTDGRFDLTNVTIAPRRAAPQGPSSLPVPTPRLPVSDWHQDAPMSRVEVVAASTVTDPVKGNVVPAPRVGGMMARLKANEEARMVTKTLDDGATVQAPISSYPVSDVSSSGDVRVKGECQEILESMKATGARF